MNRYTVDGVLADLRAGRRVVIVSGNGPARREAMGVVAARLVRQGECMYRAHGQERCTSTTGGVVRFVLRTALRGLTADVVVVDGHAPTLDEATDLGVLAQSGAEVIR